MDGPEHTGGHLHQRYDPRTALRQSSAANSRVRGLRERTARQMARVTTDGWENMEPANVFRTIRASARAGSWYTVPRAHASRLSAVIKPQFVRVAPGSMSTTYTPNGAISMRRASENASTAYLDTLYQPPKYRQALKFAGVPVTHKTFPTGGHGFGFNTSFTYHNQMLQDLTNWLQGLNDTIDGIEEVKAAYEPEENKSPFNATEHKQSGPEFGSKKNDSGVYDLNGRKSDFRFRKGIVIGNNMKSVIR